MYAQGRRLWWKASAGAVIALALAASFAAYLQPDMLVHFASLAFCF